MLDGHIGKRLRALLNRDLRSNSILSTISPSLESESLLQSSDQTLSQWPTKQVECAMLIDDESKADTAKNEVFLIPESSRRQSSKIAFLTGLVMVTSVSIFLIWSTAMWFTSRRQLSCGNSIEEAVIRGCSFDPLTVTWLPHQCSRAGTEEFLQANGNNTWRYYFDEGGSKEMFDLGSRLGDRIYWTTQGEHLTHCAYILIRAAEAAHAGVRIDHTSGAMHHTRHCALFLLENAKFSPQFDEVVTAGNVRLGGC